jgi:hypothetical protein
MDLRDSSISYLSDFRPWVFDEQQNEALDGILKLEHRGCDDELAGLKDGSVKHFN